MVGRTFRSGIVLDVVSYAISVSVLKIGPISSNSDALGVDLFLIYTDISRSLLLGRWLIQAFFLA